jgi:hypothetical protein
MGGVAARPMDGGTVRGWSKLHEEHGLNGPEIYGQAGFLTQECQKTGSSSVESATGNFRAFDPKGIRVLTETGDK